MEGDLSKKLEDISTEIVKSYLSNLNIDSIETIGKSVVQQFIGNDTELVKLSIHGNKLDKNLEMIRAFKNSLHFISADTLLYEELLWMKFSSTIKTKTDTEIESEILDLASLAKNCVEGEGFFDISYCSAAIPNSIGQLNDRAAKICQMVGHAMLNTFQDKKISPTFFNFWKAIVDYGKVFIPPEPGLRLCQTTQFEVKIENLICGDDAPLTTEQIDCLKGFTDCRLQELTRTRTRNSSNKLLEEDTLLFFEAIEKLEVTMVEEFNDTIYRSVLTLGRRHIRCKQNLDEYRYRLAIIRGFNNLAVTLVERYRSDGYIPTVQVKKLVNTSVSSVNTPAVVSTSVVDISHRVHDTPPLTNSSTSNDVSISKRKLAEISEDVPMQSDSITIMVTETDVNNSNNSHGSVGGGSTRARIGDTTISVTSEVNSILLSTEPSIVPSHSSNSATVDTKRMRLNAITVTPIVVTIPSDDENETETHTPSVRDTSHTLQTNSMNGHSESAGTAGRIESQTPSTARLRNFFMEEAALVTAVENQTLNIADNESLTQFLLDHCGWTMLPVRNNSYVRGIDSSVYCRDFDAEDVKSRLAGNQPLGELGYQGIEAFVNYVRQVLRDDYSWVEDEDGNNDSETQAQ